MYHIFKAKKNTVDILWVVFFSPCVQFNVMYSTKTEVYCDRKCFFHAATLLACPILIPFTLTYPHASIKNRTAPHRTATRLLRMFEGPVDLGVALALVDAAPESYKFSTFHDNNRLLEEAFLRDPSDGWRLIDSYTPTVLRPDLHIGGNDCLHYCIPGPTDHWVRLLYNVLLVATGGDGRGVA